MVLFKFKYRFRGENKITACKKLKVLFGKWWILLLKTWTANLLAHVKDKICVCTNILACLFSVHNTIRILCHEQVCLIRLHFERYFSHHRAS